MIPPGLGSCVTNSRTQRHAIVSVSSVLSVVLQPHLKLDLVAQGDAVPADEGDLRLEAALGVQGIGVDGDEAEAAFLVEVQSLHVVIGGDEPEARTASPQCSTLHGGDEG